MSKTSLSLCVMIATLLAVVALFFLPKPQAQIISTTTVKPGMVQKTCMLDGEAGFGDRQPLISPLSGQVEQVYVKSGQLVEKGQLLFRLSTAMEELALQQLQYQQYQLENYLGGIVGQLPWTSADLLANVNSQQQTLLSTIATKQIRADCDGRIENLYVQVGEYVAASSVAGSISGKEMTISSVWFSQDGAPPVPGMNAWWCDAYGNQLEPLILESVGAPTLQNTIQIYPLVFSCVWGNESKIRVGEKAPVCLVLEEQAANAVVTAEALDDQQQVWVVQNDSVKPVKVAWADCEDNALQLPDEWAGSKVVLNPDQLDLQEGMKLNLSEGL
ncbi:MAG: biotin/lipoyl-binding protein [Clostridia bacterium]|nr:biotin/lipoyl-binding protein [Clostridia bacterium]